MTNRKLTPVVDPRSYKTFKNFMITGIKALKTIGKYLNNSEMQVSMYLIEHMNFSDNSVNTNYDHITKGAHVSRATVASTLRKLTNLGLIKKNMGLIFINPNWVFKGSHQKYEKLNHIFPDLFN